MNRQQLVELARDVLTHLPLKQLLVAGSQAFYGVAHSAPDVVIQSIEVDFLLTGEDFAHRQAIEDRFGMASQYLAQTGVFAHPVGRGTIILPPGWEERLVAFGRDESLPNVWAVEIHDTTASKLMAGREKDFEFLRVLIERGLVDFPILLQRLQLFRPTVFANALPDRLAKLARHLRDWQRDDLARIVESQLHG